jgi:hypothetical protein
LNNTSSISFHSDGGAGGKVQYEMKARMTERLENASTQTGSSQNLGITEGDGPFQFAMSMDGKSMPWPPDFDQALNNAKHLAMEVSVDRNGSLFRVQPAYDGAPEESKHSLQHFAGLICRSLDLSSLPFPNGEVRPGQRWRADRQVPMMTLGEELILTARLLFVYRGVRMVNGHELAVVTFSGHTPGSTGPEGAVGGTILVDVAQGRVAKATATVNSSMQLHMQIEKTIELVRARCRLDMVLTRE